MLNIVVLKTNLQASSSLDQRMAGMELWGSFQLMFSNNDPLSSAVAAVSSFSLFSLFLRTSNDLELKFDKKPSADKTIDPVKLWASN